MNDVEIKKLTEYFLRENYIDTTKKYIIEKVPAKELICANRFDLMAKLIYIDAFEKNMDMDWAINIYSDNINAFSCGTFKEPGTERKNSLEKYINQFGDLITDIKDNGFDEKKSIIPIGKDNIILDGAHRVAVAAYYNKDVSIIRFPELKRKYNYEYFRKYLMSAINMGYMANEYARICGGCFMACIWPVADNEKIAEVTKLIKDVGEIVYEQDVYLTYQGMCNFMAQIYGHQAWTGSIDSHFEGVKAKVNCCYNKKNPVHTYLFEANNLDVVLELKNRIRGLFDLGNHSVHISDDDSETRMMTALLYNPNSVNFLNYAEPFKHSMVFKKMKAIKEKIQEDGYETDRFIIDSSSVMEVCGLRAARDVDYLTDYRKDEAREKEKSNNIINLEDVDNHESQLPYYKVGITELLYNPENYFFFNGMKFVSVDRLIEMKSNRGEQKDQIDVKLLKSFVKQFNNTPRKYSYETIKSMNSFMIKNDMYGRGGEFKYKDYCFMKIQKIIGPLYIPYRIVKKRIKFIIDPKYRIDYLRGGHINKLRKSLKNKDFSVISSNCNGGVICSDLGVPFNSPFVNMFIKADDFVKLCSDLRTYMDSDLVFVKENDPIYGEVSYPTAYLRDVKIYFMHYADEAEARLSWYRRKKRINWDNLFLMFTDRSGCTQKNLEDFDRLPYKNKVVFTHIPHPEIKSAFYIKGYEEEDKVGVLSAFENEKLPVKRVYEQFDLVGWLNGEGKL